MTAYDFIEGEKFLCDPILHPFNTWIVKNKGNVCLFFKKRNGAGPGLLESKHREAQAELTFPCLQRGSHAYIHQNTHTHKSIHSCMVMSSTSTDVHTQSNIKLNPETHM